MSNQPTNHAEAVNEASAAYRLQVGNVALVKPGYKMTEVGVIPEDWGVKAMDEVSFVTSGKRLPLGSSLVDQPTPHPYIRVTDMRPGTIELSEIRFVPESVFPAIKRYRIYQADIFISVAGTLGIVGKIPAELDGANLTENADRITNITCVQDYLLYVLMSPLIQNTVNSIQTVGAQPKLALERIRKFKIPLPPTDAEQRAIAAALSDVDALLDGLERLIAKKRDLKQAAMQQLLTGQTRLPGFSGEWEVMSLSALTSSPIQNGVFNEPSRKGRGCKLINVIDLYSEPPIDTQVLELFEADNNEISRFAVSHGDIFFTRSSLTPDGIAHCNIYDRTENEVVVFDCHLIRVRPNKKLVNPFFLFRYCTAYNARKYLISNSKTTTMTTVDQSVISNLPILLPSLPEQTAIATILSDMDAELAALEGRRDKTRALKQGMMQELLTGRTRLL